MAYEFEKLSEVSALEKFPDNAKILIEHEGEIKRCAGNLGGSVEIIELSYDGETVTGPTDRTPEELWELVKNGTTLIANLEVTVENQTQKLGGVALTFYSNRLYFGFLVYYGYNPETATEEWGVDG